MSVRDWLRSFATRLSRRRAREDELARELAAHLSLEAEEQQESGLAVDEAHYAARRAFGNSTLVQEDVREVWNVMWLERFARDVKYAARSLRKSPGFAAVAILTLALGIGANTAIFSAINALMLQPLPFAAADQLVRINSTINGVPITGFAYPGGPSLLDMRDFAENSHSFQKIVVYDTWRKNVSFGDSAAEPEQMQVGLVPASYFEALEIQPIIGRLFTEEENQEGQGFVALISARAQAAQEIGKLKRSTSLPVYEPNRERVIFENVRAANKGPLPDIELMHIYERIIDVMRALQKDELASNTGKTGK